MNVKHTGGFVFVDGENGQKHVFSFIGTIRPPDPNTAPDGCWMAGNTLCGDIKNATLRLVRAVPYEGFPEWLGLQKSPKKEQTPPHAPSPSSHRPTTGKAS